MSKNQDFNELKRAYYFFKINPLFLIQHKLDFLQQKAWNMMLLSAHKNLLSEDYHEIAVALLLKSLDVKSPEIVFCKLADMKANESTDPLNLELYFEDIKITNDFIVYKYPYHLRILFSHKIVGEVTRKLNATNLDSKYALFLYELCLYCDVVGYLNFFPHLHLRRYLGIHQDQYINAKYLIDSVLIQAINKVNEKTDYVVTCKQCKMGRVTVGFRITTKNKAGLGFTSEEKINFALQNFSFAKAFYMFNEKLDVGQSFIERHISSSEKKFIYKFFK